VETKYGLKSSLVENLIQKPFLFNFFQAVRLFDIGYGVNQAETTLSYMPIGSRALPHYDVIRLKNKMSLAFPSTTISGFTPSTFDAALGHDSPPSLTTSILGLTGSIGSLPQYYTDILLAQKRLGNAALIDFLEIFDHRLLTLYYRAWAKRRIFIPYEIQQQNPTLSDKNAFMLKSLHGNELKLSSNQQSGQNISVFYAGLLSQQPRSANGLIQLLTSYLSLPVSIRQCEEEWLALSESNQTVLGQKQNYNQLGCSIILGKKIKSARDKFILIMEAINYKTFCKLNPYSVFIHELHSIIKYYINNNLKYNINIILKKEEVPFCKLSSEFQLGWNTWLLTKTPLQDKEDTLIKQLANYQCSHKFYSTNSPQQTKGHLN
jgi:type VI secretion system protein ImpH